MSESKGNYATNKVRLWLEGLGYEVHAMEIRTSFTDQNRHGIKRTHSQSRNISGCDLMAKSETETIFVRVKARRQEVAAGVQELLKYRWSECKCTRLWVVYWEKNASKPVVKEVER